MTAPAFYTPNRQKLYLLGGGQVDTVRIGARIKAARKARGLTQAELAQDVDITPKYLSNIECGAKVPKMETFIEIANALEVDANTLLVDVLTVSSAIISTEISEQLAALSPHERKRIKRIFDVMIEDAVKQPK
jgi:transcriptional regulator with XRE-family HTH domain